MARKRRRRSDPPVASLGIYNSPFAVALLRGRQPTLIHLWRREQGLLVPAGNPRGIEDPKDLRELRVAKREFGAGTRVLLDRMLDDTGIAPYMVAGPEAGSHLEVALAVASGVADVGLGVRAAAAALALEFVPLVWEEYDVVLSAESLGASGPLIDTLRDKTVRASILEASGSLTQLADHRERRRFTDHPPASARRFPAGGSLPMSSPRPVL